MSNYKFGDLYLIEFDYKYPSKASDDTPFFRYRCFTWEDKFVIGETSKVIYHKDKSTGEIIEEVVDLPKQITERKRLAIKAIRSKLIEWHEKRGWKRTSKKDADILTFQYGKSINLEIKNFKCVKFDRKIS